MSHKSKNRKLVRTHKDVHTKTSKRKGALGTMEGFLRRFRGVAFYVTIAPVGFIYVVILSLSIAPGAYLFLNMQQMLEVMPLPLWKQALAYGVCLSLAWVIFGLSVLFWVPVFNFPLLPYIKPMRTIWYSLEVIAWYYHNALTQLARYAFLNYVTPTPINLLFYRMMGMKIGKGCVINSSNISDPCLIELEDHVTVGGSATIFAHYGMKGFLIVERVKIGKGATIGLKASVMGDVEIAPGQMVAPHTVLTPKTRIGFESDESNEESA